MVIRIRHNCISWYLKFDRSLTVLRQRQLIVGKIELQYGMMVPTGRVLKLNWTPASSLGTSPAQERHPRIAILTSSQAQKIACSMFSCNYGDSFLYSEGKNISCLQYKSLQKRSYTHLATLTPRDPPSPAFCLFWMHKTNLGWECAAKYPHHPSKISASLYYKVNKTTEQRNIQNKGRGVAVAGQFHRTDCICHHMRATYTDHHTRKSDTRTQRGNRGSSLIRTGRRQNKRWRRGTKHTRQQAGRAL